MPAAAVATPPLTTVWQPHARKGVEAVRMLFQPAPTRAVLLLPTKVVPHASTVPPA
ncbi:hypothetical protein RM555_04630 [Micromonospora sp. DSM 115977]|uniref:LacI family transcriptional regulator n=1 Tax=Micromonospora reichwaldensis TaxID=3075516 RepID=A0ABU2WSC2_9ACTN|nr:hypothetical protein [Micromonospora sp. DSM 115977]MDT0528281.1 hypothetical protein [Micromonospora sp. DSM 115977]